MMTFEYFIYWMSTFIIMTLDIPISSGQHMHRIAKPIFHETQRNVTVHVGETAVLNCTIEHLGPKVVNWRKLGDEYPLTVGDMVFARYDGYSLRHKNIHDHLVSWNLVIKKVEMKHAGEYECQVSSTGSYTYRITMTVLDTPIQDIPRITMHGTRYVNLYQRISLLCNASGVDGPPSDIEWFLNGNKISVVDGRWRNRVHISSYISNNRNSLISKLIINFSKHEDQGIYICRSSETDTVSEIVHVLNVEKEKTLRDVNKYHEPTRDFRNKTTTIYMDVTLLLVTLVMIIK